MSENDTTVHQTDFPFEEVRDENGDFFHTIEEAEALGYKLNQIWSVIFEDDYVVYGPSHHYINREGYVATEEKHDDKTYYEEKIEMD